MERTWKNEDPATTTKIDTAKKTILTYEERNIEYICTCTEPNKIEEPLWLVATFKKNKKNKKIKK